MHSYQHNIKTFNSATMHLTHVERSLYRCLIELYYDTEQPLPATNFDRLARRVMAFSDDEKESLKFVLDEFFTKTGDVYTHDYCDEVIEAYQNNTSSKSKAGKASAEARRKKAAARKAQREAEAKAENQQNSTDVEQVLNPVETEGQQNSTNHKPLTNNQLKKTHKKKAAEITPVASVCIEMSKFCRTHNKDPSKISQSNPKLVALVEAGATAQEFVDGLQAAFDANKKNYVAYAIGTVEGRRRDAAELKGKIHTGALPAATQAKSVMAKTMLGHLRKGASDGQESIEVVAERVD